MPDTKEFVLPTVAVLLATYNGAPWLKEQLDSIVSQQNVIGHLIVSDDLSTDGTRHLLESFATASTLTFSTCHPEKRCGTAGRNFYHLLAHAPIGNAQFVALADQDDLWLPDKLHRAVQALQTQQCSGYSSNVLAWYPERAPSAALKLVNKAQPQVAHDHLFQGPGPGCTFVLTREHFDAFRQFLLTHWDDIQEVTYHDWLIYAHARATGRKWYIDPQPGMKYRQHAHNALGASLGVRGLTRRLKLLRQGWLRDQTLHLARLLGCQHQWPAEALARLTLKDRLCLAIHVCQFRRGWRDRIALGLSLLFLLRGVS